ncbi:hypothetical protein E2C01_084789 [Portunus trituberculatus]|uniref:Uncharacterized protein n=1 Tax=Portunus trituberculatus TaxID=210409 RepID=A0A5B7J533_PORTR|nr:hypothetical protein [Portunus trituberculatus]
MRVRRKDGSVGGWVEGDAPLFTCDAQVTQRARGSIYHWGAAVVAPAPGVCSGNNPHTRRFPWQPPVPSGAAISTSSSFLLSLAAPPPTHCSFRLPAEGGFSYNHFGLTRCVRLRSVRAPILATSNTHQQLDAAAGEPGTALNTLRAALRVTAHHRT